MPSSLSSGTNIIEIPFLINLSSPEFDKTVIFIVAVLLAITVNAEAQSFMAAMFGDTGEGEKDRFHFNPFLHINLAGLICFAVAGFGWPKQVKINVDRFRHPAIAVMIIRFAGAFGNLLLAGIAGSILFVMKKWNLEDQVFSIIISVNIMMFVYNFLPVPPLAGGYIIFCIFSVLFPRKINVLHNNTNANLNETNNNGSRCNSFNPWKLAERIAPYFLAGLFIAIRINGWTLLNESLYPVVKSVFRFITG